MKTLIKVLGAWKQAKKVFLKQAGVWKPVRRVFVKVAGIWEMTYQFILSVAIPASPYQTDATYPNNIRWATAPSSAVYDPAVGANLQQLQWIANGEGVAQDGFQVISGWTFTILYSGTPTWLGIIRVTNVTTGVSVDIPYNSGTQWRLIVPAPNYLVDEHQVNPKQDWIRASVTDTFTFERV